MNPSYSSSQLKKLASKWLKKTYDGVNPLFEYHLTGLAKRTIDVAAFHHGVLIGIEIKGHGDRLKPHHFKNQSDDYPRACSPIYLLTCPRTVEYPTPPHWGRLRVAKDGLEVESEPEVRLPQDKSFMLRALNRGEIAEIAAERRVDLSGLNCREEEAEKLAGSMSSEEVVRALERFTLRPLNERVLSAQSRRN